jgi:glycosyltransferase involved in cell wall biosynthesis
MPSATLSDRRARLKIVHTDTDDIENPLRGGQPVRTYSVNSRLASRHDITVLTAVYKGCRRKLTRNGIAYQRLGVRVPGWGLSPHLSFLALLGFSVARRKPDLVVEEFTPPVGFCGLPWWTKAPVVLTVQWYFFEQWEKRYRLPFGRWMRKLAAKRRYRFVIVQSHAMEREIRSVLPHATIRKIPSGIDDKAFLPATGVGEYALFLGRLDMEHKGLDLLIAAWKHACTAAQIPLVIAGEGDARPALEALIAREGLGHLIRLIGRVEGDAKTKALQGSRLVVMPSRYETFGIAALEAMAAAKPVICFDIDHMNELAAPPWAVHVPKFDSNAFGEAVVKLWSDEPLCQHMGRQAQEQARTYHWDEIAQQQEAFYFEVLNASGS